MKLFIHDQTYEYNLGQEKKCSAYADAYADLLIERLHEYPYSQNELFVLTSFANRLRECVSVILKVQSNGQIYADIHRDA